MPRPVYELAEVHDPIQILQREVLSVNQANESEVRRLRELLAEIEARRNADAGKLAELEHKVRELESRPPAPASAAVHEDSAPVVSTLEEVVYAAVEERILTDNGESGDLYA